MASGRSVRRCSLPIFHALVRVLCDSGSDLDKTELATPKPCASRAKLKAVPPAANSEHSTCTSTLRRVHRPRSCTPGGKVGANQEQIHFTSSSSTSKLYHQWQIRSIPRAHPLCVKFIDLEAVPPEANSEQSKSKSTLRQVHRLQSCTPSGK